MGGSGQKSRYSDFDFAFLVQNILKQVDINFYFKVLAKFGDYTDNKDIQKLGFEFFLSNALAGWLGSDERWINPTIFIFVETFPLAMFQK